MQRRSLKETRRCRISNIRIGREKDEKEEEQVWIWVLWKTLVAYTGALFEAKSGLHNGVE